MNQLSPTKTSRVLKDIPSLEGEYTRQIRCDQCQTILETKYHYEPAEGNGITFHSEPVFCKCNKQYYCRMENGNIMVYSKNSEEKEEVPVSKDIPKPAVCWRRIK